MSDLSPEAQALLLSGRGMFRPPAAARARVAELLATQLGEPPPAALLAEPVSRIKIASALVGAGLIGAGAIFALSQSGDAAPSRVRLPAAVSVLPSAPVANTVQPTSEVPPDPAVVEPPRPETRAPAARDTDHLAEEVSILARATGALRAGRAGEALQLLNEHQRRFPSGRLSEERRGARAQALCALGRRSEAESELTRLARVTPRSLHLARARKACGFVD
jgi:hypothetical protein